MKAFLKEMFEHEQPYEQLGLPSRVSRVAVWLNLNLLARTRRTAFAVAPSPYGAYDAEQ